MGILEGKRAVIVGASGAIGLACAKECIAEGATVYGSYRKKSNGISGLAAAEPEQFHGFWMDLSDTAQIAPVLNKTIKEAGGVDILINAAGISRPQPFFITEAANWEETLSTNLTAIFHTMQSVVVPMMAGHGGSVVNISSVAGLKGMAGQSAYCASKAGIIGLSRAAALELAAKNIRVNVVAPGYIDTDMISTADEKYRRQFLEEIPMRRFGTPQECAQMCAFLASDKAGYITGQTFIVDGGCSI